MSEKPASPFSGLDKALLRSTQPQPAAPVQEQPEEEVYSVDEKKSKQTRKEVSHKDSKIASMIDSTTSSYQRKIIETIRKAVKMPGKEVSFIRLTREEKDQLTEIVYTYKRQGKKTSENEINRIALNFLLQDYKANGNDSILAKVIDALLA